MVVKPFLALREHFQCKLTDWPDGNKGFGMVYAANLPLLKKGYSPGWVWCLHFQQLEMLIADFSSVITEQKFKRIIIKVRFLNPTLCIWLISTFKWAGIFENWKPLDSILSHRCFFVLVRYTHKQVLCLWIAHLLLPKLQPSVFWQVSSCETDYN